MNRLDRYQGCLLGGAVGDALGYPVEFDTRNAILSAYGPQGITDYVLSDGIAQISDDTQMTLFTANALLFSDTRRRIGAPGGTVEEATTACYRDWLRTQQEPYPLPDGDYISWLVHIPELYQSPGTGKYLSGGYSPGGQRDYSLSHQPKQRLRRDHARCSPRPLFDQT